MLSTKFEYIAKTRKEARERPARFYYTGKPCKRLHWSKRTKAGICSECRKVYDSRDDARNPWRKNEERKRRVKASRERYHSDPNYRRKRIDDRMEWHNNKMETDPEYAERYREKVKVWSRRRWEKIGSKEEANRRWRRWQNKLKKEQPDRWKAIVACRNMIQRCIDRGYKKDETTVEALGYSPVDLVNHLENQFSEGMTWENHGEWHVDHIRPICSFPLDTPPSVVSALSNLQPLWKDDNMAKSGDWK